jgi:hypothetical protein
MARLLKDGTYKPAPSAAKRSARMQGSIIFTEALRKGTNVKIYVGSGWEKGTVTDWQKNRVTVRLNRGNKTVTCYDARNLQTL